MVERVQGNLLDAEVEALVNTVNSVGIMGKGIALQFKKAFPENFKAYKKACETKQVRPGQMFIHDLGGFQQPRFIINFPTKRDWRSRSKIEDIAAGLDALIQDVRRLGIQSIALPPLGCGNGGLDWGQVSRMIEEAFATLANVRVLMYEPAGAPAADKMKNRTARPKMTVGRAVIIGLMDRYLATGYGFEPSVLEVYKLAYFMQEAGEPLKLDFQEGPYGPYADNLRHVLNHIEGHFIQGFGDGRNEPNTKIHLLPGVASEAASVLEGHEATRERFNRVVELIEGFETHLGMELLSSVHWVATRKDLFARTDFEAVVRGVQGWNDRKARIFNRKHIEAAWSRLRGLAWL